MAIALRWGEPLTYDDLEGTPDDGHRYELIDGMLLVTPAPNTAHQAVLASLYRLLWDSHPDGTAVLFAPVDYVPEPHTALQPDLLVVRREDVGGANVTATPLLVVEILSPSTRAADLGAKRVKYAELGVPAYWIIDPDEPSLLALHLEAGQYHEAARVTGAEAYEAAAPFAVTITPAKLLDL